MGGVGQRIKELRKAAHLTQQELAEGVVTRSYISQIEKGLIQPSYDTLEKLAKKLDVTVEDFFKEPENKALMVAEWKKYIRFAEGHIQSGQFDQAQRVLDQTKITSFEELNDFDLGVLEWVRGKLAYHRRSLNDAVQHFKRSLDHFGNKYAKERIRSMDSLASVYMHQGRDVEALQTLNTAHEILIQEHVGGLIKVSLLVNSGIAHARLGEHHSAIRLLREANALNQSMNTYYKAGHICMTEGICHMHFGNWEEGERSFQRAIDFYDMVEQWENKAAAYNNLGILYAKSKNYTRSIETLLRSISLFQEIGHQAKLTEVKAELADAYLRAGDYRLAELYCRQVLQADDAYKHKARAHSILGQSDFEQKHFAEALVHFQESFDLYRAYGYEKESLEVLRFLGDSYLNLGQYEDAARTYHRMHAAKERETATHA
jgi:tetratricopeptide (TPR) repeat protein